MNLFVVWITFFGARFSRVKAIFYFSLHSFANIRLTFSRMVHLLCQN